MENAESVHDIPLKRFRSSEFYPVRNKGHFVFPVATGDLRQPEYGTRKLRPKRKKKKSSGALVCADVNPLFLNKIKEDFSLVMRP